MTDKIITKIVDEVKKNRSFLVASHMNPEGDAIGSTLALAISLKSIGKDVTAYNQDHTPWNLQFLPMSTEIVHEIDESYPYDVAIVLDCAEFDRLGKGGKEIGKIGEIINIDHHKTNSKFGDLSYVDPYASSSAEIIYGLLKDIPVEMSHDIAVNIYTAIFTDTGSFRYANTTAKTFQIAGELVKAGVDTAKVAEEVYERQSSAQLRLLGLALNTLEVSENGRIGSMAVLSSMLKEAEATSDLTENMVNYPKSIRGVQVAVLFKEVSGNYYRISFRSYDNVDVSDIAKEFGGGGHPRAAGCGTNGSLTEVKEMVFDAIRRRLM